MFNYAFYRIYRQRRDSGDSHPLLGAVIGWAFYVGAVAIPSIVFLASRRVSVLPNRLLERPFLMGLVVFAIPALFSYGRWVRSGSVYALEELYASDSRTMRILRVTIFWGWIVFGLILFLVAIRM
jgi:hypothetical protein